MSDAKNNNPRRKFLSWGLPMLVGSGLAGCTRHEEIAQESSTESLRQTDPKLILFEEESPIATGLEEAKSLCIGPKDTIYLAGDREIAVCDATGKKLRAIALSATPRAVTVHDDGTVFIALDDHVEVFDKSGERKAIWPSLGESALLTAITSGQVNGRDTVWAANSAGRIVLRYDAQGRVTGRIGQKDEAKKYPGLIVPSPHLDVAFAPDGKLRINNPGMHRVETHTPDGTFISAWGTASSDVRDFCGCCNPTDFALLPDGRFITAEKGIPRVKLYSASGKFEGVVAPAESFAMNTMGLDLAALSDGRILVLDPQQKAVRVFRRKGKAA